jgi:hypothetical protein
LLAAPVKENYLMTTSTKDQWLMAGPHSSSSKQADVKGAVTFVLLRPADTIEVKCGRAVLRRSAGRGRWIMLAGMIVATSIFYLLFVVRVCGC